MSNIILCGFKGSGKTTFGRKIAENLRLAFLDTDALVRKVEDEKLFRLLEKEAVLSLQHVQNTVIATGGGTVLDPDNVAILKKLGTIIYLQVDKEELRKKPLPIFITDFEKMYQDRLPIYEKIADVIINPQAWEVILSELSFASLRGGNRTEKPSAS